MRMLMKHLNRVTMSPNPAWAQGYRFSGIGEFELLPDSLSVKRAWQLTEASSRL